MCSFFFIYLVFLLVTSFVRSQVNVTKNETIQEIGPNRGQISGTLTRFETLSPIEANGVPSLVTPSTGFSVSPFVTRLGKVFQIKSGPNQAITRRIESRIVDGKDAFLGQFPQQVSLRRAWSGYHFCGGTIIHLQWILTAAHCMFVRNYPIEASGVIVVAGDLLLTGSATTRQKKRAKRIIVHRKYNSNTIQNDIALIELMEPFVKNFAIQVARIPKRPFKPGTLCQVSGWGKIHQNKTFSPNKLQFVDLPLVSKHDCRILLDEEMVLFDGMLCAGYLEGGKDSCEGDSGGGMLCNNYLTGIVSGGIGCGNPKLPGFYTDVFYYRTWINSSMHHNNSGNIHFLNIFLLISLSLCLYFQIITL